MLFKDRRQAGEQLAARLQQYRGRNPLILAVPRGGVTVAEPIWAAIGGELDLIITRKIGAPHQPELAVGAVAGDGFLMLNETLVARLKVPAEHLRTTAEREQTEIKRRLEQYRGNRPLPEPGDRPIIVVDDGVATGYTLLAALRSLQQNKPAELILVVPVGPPDTFRMLQAEVDRLIYLEAPASFSAVGQFYLHFGQVSDAEVLSVLRKAWQEAG